jgi:hypothetical protein
MLRAHYLIRTRLDSCLILFELRLKLGNLEDGHRLAFPHMGSVIDVQRANIPGLFGVDIDFLKRNQFGTYREVIRKRPRFDASHAHRDAIRLRAIIIFRLNRFLVSAGAYHDCAGDHERRTEAANAPLPLGA